MKNFNIKICPLCQSTISVHYKWSGEDTNSYLCPKLHYKVEFDSQIKQIFAVNEFVVLNVYLSGKSIIYKRIDDSLEISPNNKIMEIPMIMPSNPVSFLKKIKTLIPFS